MTPFAPGTSTRRPMTLAWLWLMPALVVVPGVASAQVPVGQVQLGGSLSVRQQYNSNIRGESGGERQEGFVTEVSPRLGLRWTLPRATVELAYRFGGQVYILPGNSSTGTEVSALFGYDNTLNASLNARIDRRTTLSVANQFVQGTENTVVSGRVTTGGGLVRGLPLASHSFVSDRLDLLVSRRLTERWAITPSFSGGFYRVYDLSTSPKTAWVVPHQVNTGVGLAVTHRTQFQQLSARVGATWLGSQSALTGQDHPLLSTMTVDATVGWGWQVHRFVTLRADAGVAGRFAQQESVTGDTDPTYAAGDFATGLTPVGSASVRVDDGRGLLSGVLGYRHAYATDFQIASSAVSEDDTAYLGGTWRWWRLTVNVNASYSFMRLTSLVQGAESSSSAHWLGADASVDLRLLDSLALSAGYRYDMLKPSDGDASPLTEYDRHLVSLGAVLTWPAPRLTNS